MATSSRAERYEEEEGVGTIYFPLRSFRASKAWLKLSQKDSWMRVPVDSAGYGVLSPKVWSLFGSTAHQAALFLLNRNKETDADIYIALSNGEGGGEKNKQIQTLQEIASSSRSSSSTGLSRR